MSFAKYIMRGTINVPKLAPIMWPFLDPIECRVAEHYRAHQQPLEAARILLSAKDRGHKTVRELLLRIMPLLLEQAQQVFAAGELPLAAELIDCAGQCAELPPDARVLADRITLDLSRRRQQQDWNQRRLEQADRWAREGRLRSAIGLIEPLADDPQVLRRRLDWKLAVERLDRYAAEFHEHLARGEVPAAQAVLQKARDLAPGQPLVLCLEQELPAAHPTVASPECEQPSPRTQEQTEFDDQNPHRTSRWLLSGLAIAGETLLLSSAEFTVGAAHGATVDLPIQALLRHRHALLIREDAPGPCGQRRRLLPLGKAAVLVNGATIPDGGSIWLAHGDQLQFGPATCRWTYRLPVANSSTAVLDQSRPDGAVAMLTGRPPIRRVVLLDDELWIGQAVGENHLVEPSLPVGRLRLRHDGHCWRAAVDHGAMFVNDDEESVNPDRPLRLPAELLLFADGPNLIGNALQGERGEYKRTLKLMTV